MEELKLLVEMVANLPSMALWVIAFFFAYKVMIVGSIYGVIRFAVEHFVKWRTFVPPVVIPPPLEFKVGTKTINEEVSLALIAQLTRLAGNSSYIHMSNVIELKNLIDQIELAKKEKP